MARDTSGPKNEPQYSAAGAPSDGADLSEVATYAANVGNRKVGTSAARVALTGADVWNGLEYYETDTGLRWLYAAGAWAVLSRLGVDLSISAAISILNNTLTVFGTAGANAYTEVTDAPGWHDAVTNPTRITPNISGTYMITVHGNCATNSTGTRQVHVRKNGTDIPGGAPVTQASVDSSGDYGVSLVQKMNGSTDYFDVAFIHSAGTTLPVVVFVTVEFMRAA